MSKLARTAAAAFCATLVDEWARAGVRHAVVAPGSRSAPLALALAADDRIEVHVRLDERSAGFVALGLGLGSGRPAVLLTTSGTAAAEVHAAVLEAHHAKVPLLVCTADRPPELHHVGAPQTVEQVGLYGAATRWSADVGVPDRDVAHTWRSIASRAVAETLAGPLGPGPVHLNLAFREPLVGDPGDAADLPRPRDDGPWHEVHRGVHRGPHRLGPDDEPTLERILGNSAGGRRGIIVAGAGCGDPALVLEAAAALGWPVLADARSGCRDLALRATDAGPTPVIVATADSLLRSGTFAKSHEPDVVIRLGESWTSKVVNTWLDETAERGTVHVLVDPYGSWSDPGRQVAHLIAGQPQQVCHAIVGTFDEPAPSRWADSWREAEACAQAAIDGALSAENAETENNGLTEPFVARTLAADSRITAIVAASSMPVRDLEWFARPAVGFPTVFANRGANGIDGVASTTIGVSIGLPGDGCVVGLVGDLAFLHDLTALVRPAGTTGLGTRRPCCLVVVDNGGGGIFSFLPQAELVEEARYEQLFGTPQAVDVASAARGLGCHVVEAATVPGFVKGLDETIERSAAGVDPVVLVVRSDRPHNTAVHRALNDAVAAALEA